MMVSVPSTEGYDGLHIGNQPVLLVVFNIEDDALKNSHSKLLLQIEEVAIINVALILIKNLSTSLLAVTLWELLSAYALLISGMKPAAGVEYF